MGSKEIHSLIHSEEYTCCCGIYVHPNVRALAWHLPDCLFYTEVENKEVERHTMAKHNDMTKYEYQILTKTWEGPTGAAWNVACETCIEFGWMDHFGIVTPKGQKAIEEYEKCLPE